MALGKGFIQKKASKSEFKRIPGKYNYGYNKMMDGSRRDRTVYEIEISIEDNE